jgi:hypothetical protein
MPCIHENTLTIYNNCYKIVIKIKKFIGVSTSFHKTPQKLHVATNHARKLSMIHACMIAQALLRKCARICAKFAFEFP